jgi:hypothetical protein
MPSEAATGIVAGTGVGTIETAEAPHAEAAQCLGRQCGHAPLPGWIDSNLSAGWPGAKGAAMRGRPWVSQFIEADALAGRNSASATRNDRLPRCRLLLRRCGVNVMVATPTIVVTEGPMSQGLIYRSTVAKRRG